MRFSLFDRADIGTTSGQRKRQRRGQSEERGKKLLKLSLLPLLPPPFFAPTTFRARPKYGNQLFKAEKSRETLAWQATLERESSSYGVCTQSLRKCRPDHFVSSPYSHIYLLHVIQKFKMIIACPRLSTCLLAVLGSQSILCELNVQPPYHLFPGCGLVL